MFQYMRYTGVDTHPTTAQSTKLYLSNYDVSAARTYKLAVQIHKLRQNLKDSADALITVPTASYSFEALEHGVSLADQGIAAR